MKISIDIVEFLLSGTFNSIKCYNIQEVKKLIDILKYDSRVDLEYTHPFYRYKEEVETEDYIYLYLEGNTRLWFHIGCPNYRGFNNNLY